MQKLKQIPKPVHHFLIGLVLTAVLGVLAFAVVNTYTAYTDMVVQQQQQYLLVTARAVSKTLSLYISEQLRDIEILTRSPGFLTEFENYYETGGDTALREHIVSYMLSQKRGVKRIYLLDKNGDVMYQYNDYPFLEVFDESLLHLKEYAAAHTSGIGSVFRISPQHYGLTQRVVGHRGDRHRPRTGVRRISCAPEHREHGRHHRQKRKRHHHHAPQREAADVQSVPADPGAGHSAPVQGSERAAHTAVQPGGGHGHLPRLLQWHRPARG